MNWGEKCFCFQITIFFRGSETKKTVSKLGLSYFIPFQRARKAHFSPLPPKSSTSVWMSQEKNRSKMGSEVKCRFRFSQLRLPPSLKFRSTFSAGFHLRPLVIIVQMFGFALPIIPLHSRVRTHQGPGWKHVQSSTLSTLDRRILCVIRARLPASQLPPHAHACENSRQFFSPPRSKKMHLCSISLIAKYRVDIVRRKSTDGKPRKCGLEKKNRIDEKESVLVARVTNGTELRSGSLFFFLALSIVSFIPWMPLFFSSGKQHNQSHISISIGNSFFIGVEMHVSAKAHGAKTTTRFIVATTRVQRWCSKLQLDESKYSNTILLGALERNLTKAACRSYLSLLFFIRSTPRSIKGSMTNPRILLKTHFYSSPLARHHAHFHEVCPFLSKQIYLWFRADKLCVMDFLQLSWRRKIAFISSGAKQMLWPCTPGMVLLPTISHRRRATHMSLVHGNSWPYMKYQYHEFILFLLLLGMCFSIVKKNCSHALATGRKEERGFDEIARLKVRGKTSDAFLRPWKKDCWKFLNPRISSLVFFFGKTSLWMRNGWTGRTGKIVVFVRKPFIFLRSAGNT